MACVKLDISWDFDSNSKSKYFSSPIEAYCDFYFCLTQMNYAFYEIDVKNNINLYFSEPKNCKPLTITGLRFPFVYLRNIGECNMLINSSHSASLHERGLIEKTNYINNLCSYDYLLKPKENIILFFCSSQDGEFYFSQSIFPFGFYYKVDSVKSINPSGLYPVCCYIYETQEIEVEKTGTKICEFNYELTCGKEDYKWKFLNYLYCWSGDFLISGDIFESKVFYADNVNQIFNSVIDYSTGIRQYIYSEQNLIVSKDSDIINLNTIYDSQIDCYFSYCGVTYNYNSTTFDNIIDNFFQSSGFFLSGSCYVLTGTCSYNYQYSYSGIETINTYCPTYLYEDLDLETLSKFSMTGYSGFVHSNYFSGYVDSGIGLILATDDGCRNILDTIYLKSSNGSVDFCSEIYSNFSVENLDSCFLVVDCDVSINLLFGINNINKLFYKYSLELCNLANNSLEIYDSYSNFLFSTNVNLNFCYEKNSILDSDPLVKFNLQKISTSGINFKNINYDYYTFPSSCDFCYDYLLELKNETHDVNLAECGFWLLPNQTIQNNRSINCINFICTGENWYLNNKPNFYCLDLNLSNEEIVFLSKKTSSFSNDFEVKKKSLICSFSFCGVEYKYNPIDYLNYNGNKIYLPDSGINIHLHINNKQLNFTFPILALSKNQISISSDLIFKNYYSDFVLDLEYEDFCFTKQYTSIERLCIPKIKNKTQIYETPNLKLSFSNRKFVCENLYIDAFLFPEDIGIESDLINFFVYVESYFNFETQDVLSLSGLQYGSNEYDFAFLNLINKLLSQDTIEVPQAEKCLIKTQSFSGFTDYNLFPYKLNSGVNYSYASIILNNICYCQNLNNSVTGFGKTGFLSEVHFGKDFQCLNDFYNYSCSGNNLSMICYLNNNICKNGFGQIGDCHFLLKISKENLSGISGSVRLDQNYIITGSQPLFIKSDSTIQYINGNLLYNNYINYNDLNFKNICSDFNSIFYYTYPFQNECFSNLCFKLKDGCDIYSTSIFVDEGCDPCEYLITKENYSETGFISKNNLILKYPFDRIICSNYLNNTDYRNNGINIVTCQ